MIMSSMLTSLVMVAVIVAYVIFTASYLSKQVASVGYTSRWLNRIKFEFKVIFESVLILIVLIILAVVVYASFSYTFKF